MRDGMRPVLLAAALASSGLAGAQPSAAVSTVLQPYTVRYQVSYMGLNGGVLQGTLRREGNGPTWTYETRAEPSMLGSMLVDDDAYGRATMRIDAQGVRPTGYRLEDGKPGTRNDVRYDYDWEALRVTGTAKGKPVDLALKPGTQDAASVQPAVMLALLSGARPESVPVLSGTHLRSYNYRFEGKATLDTALGRVETVVWSSTREGSDRSTRSWHAPTLGYVPVQVINYRDGRPQSVLKAVALQR